MFFFSGILFDHTKNFSLGNKQLESLGTVYTEIITLLTVVVCEMLMLKDFSAGDKMMHAPGDVFEVHLQT